MPDIQEQYDEKASPPFRLEVQLHELLTKSRSLRPAQPTSSGDVKFPESVFPQHPELLAQDDDDEENLARARAGKRHWTAPLVFRAMKGWLFPYLKSRVLPRQFHPIIAYLFTEWKCNLDCHYCWSFDNSVKARRIASPP
jgi:sulfatase maturation enzyme AslB (radical SAM superfamily)